MNKIISEDAVSDRLITRYPPFFSLPMKIRALSDAAKAVTAPATAATWNANRRRLPLAARTAPKRAVAIKWANMRNLTDRRDRG
jgi:hypothetical protein